MSSGPASELRENAASLWGSIGRDREEVETELHRLEAIRDDLVEHGHINLAAYAGGGSGGGFAFTRATLGSSTAK